MQFVASLVSALSAEEKNELLQTIKQHSGIPISAFCADLSSLEIIVRFLKDIEKKSFKEIALTLDRKLSTIYTTYKKSKKKYKQALDVSDSSILIPFDLFKDRRFAVLELVIAHLKNIEKKSFKDIAVLLHKHYNTITTTYRRYVARGGL